jgi:DNA helicase IV
VDELDETGEHVRIGLRQHAVAEVEHMAGSPPGRVEDDRGAVSRHVPSGRTRGRVEVALNGPVADAFPRRRDRHAPVDSDHVGAGRRHLREQFARADTEVDARDPERRESVEDAPAGWQHMRLVFVGAEGAGPAVEYLDGGRAGRDLGDEARQRQVGEAVEQLSPQHRLAVHQRLGLHVITRRAALDEVGRDGERRAGEADQRDGELAAEEPDRVDDVGHVHVGFEVTQAGQIGGRPERLGEHRPDPGRDLDGHADRRQGRDDVAEQDRGVDAEPAHGLQRDLRCQLRGMHDLEKSVPFAQLPKFRQRSAGLSHEPHRRERRRPASAGEEKGRVGFGHRGEGSGRPVGLPVRRETRPVKSTIRPKPVEKTRLPTHPDLASEQAYLTRAYERLDAQRRAAAELRDSVIDAGPGGTHQARTERDVFVRTSLHRLEQLELGRSALCFGRIDTEQDETFYIGRIAVSDADQEPLVVDWRAPVAEAFYRATGRHPMHLIRRRHFAVDGRQLLGIEDELFRADGEAGDDLELVGPGALLAALQRSRSGHMRDIVATVQREQDEIIRAALPGVLVVQGGPGTGKTAVALHRAAYLLYTYRFPLEQQGVLVIGPNQVFLRYIEQVLPSLGESGVVLTTLAGLMPEIRPRAVEGPELSGLKGDVRMARLIARAISDRERGLRDDLVVGYGPVRLRVSAEATQSIAGSVKRRPGTHNSRRRQVETMLLRALHDSYVDTTARARRAGAISAEQEDLSGPELARELRRDPAVVAALDRMWPLMTAEELLHDLFGAPALLALAGRRLLSPEERRLLVRPRQRALGDVDWSACDLPLLDEARALLGPAKFRKKADAEPDEVRTYGHIVVDEAQDLSPMALRMLARRSISGSMTLVGDIGQATVPRAPDDWSDVLAHLPARRAPRITTLTVNYRTPAEIMAVALEVLAATDVRGLPVPRSVRSTGRLPEVRDVGLAELPEVVASVTAEELAAVAGGTVAVIAPEHLIAALGDAFDRAHLPWGEPGRAGLTQPVSLLGLVSAKGLEFDAVVVVEPAAIADEASHGLRALFVALTRTTRRLALVHADPLPEPLREGLGAARAGLAESPR